jgi:hypothetical protein
MAAPGSFLAIPPQPGLRTERCGKENPSWRRKFGVASCTGKKGNSFISGVGSIFWNIPIDLPFTICCGTCTPGGFFWGMERIKGKGSQPAGKAKIFSLKRKKI